MSEAIIVGGGIAGLSAAYYLSKKGISSTLIEAQPRLGGLIRTDVIQGCQLEAGPDSYIAAKPEVTELAREIGALQNHVIGTNDQARTIFLVKNGALVPLPAGMVMMVPADMRACLTSDLFPVCTKKSILAERFKKPFERDDDVSIAEFVEQHFDRHMLEYVAEPLLTGVYGGEAGLLSAQSVLPRFVEYERRHGSLVRAVRAERKQTAQNGSLFLSFKGGMQALVDAVYGASQAAIRRVHGQVTRVEPESGHWRVSIGSEHERAPFLIVAVPAHRAAPLFEPSNAGLALELAEIPYSSAITVILVYRRNVIGHALNGFGFLVPRSERKWIAASTWINTKFPQRIPDGYAALRLFLVGKEANDLMDKSDYDVLEAVRRDLARLMGIEAEPVFHTLNRWPKSMPQYVVGHAARRRRIQALATEYKGLFLAGNAYDGVGIPDSVRLARQAVEQITP